MATYTYASGGGLARVLAGLVAAQQGQARVGVSVALSQQGRSRVLTSLATTQRGRSRVLAGIIALQQGRYWLIVGITGVVIPQHGRARVAASFSVRQHGRYWLIVGITGVVVPQHGWSRVLTNLAPLQHGRARVENDSVEGYVVWVGTDGALPDFTAVPDGFSPTLPFDVPVTPPPSGTMDIRVTLRRRNRFGVVSQNQQHTLLTIDSNGDEVLGALSTPQILDALTGEGEKFLVHLAYPGAATDRNPADVMRLYIKKGSAPVPGVDVPVVTGPAKGEASVAIGPYTEGGAVYYLAVTVYRTADGLESDAGTDSVVLGQDPITPIPLVGSYSV